MRRKMKVKMKMKKLLGSPSKKKLSAPDMFLEPVLV